jgi:hypothetical protein
MSPTLIAMISRSVMIISMVIRYFRLMDYDMAYFDIESHKVSALENLFGPKYWGERQL